LKGNKAAGGADGLQGDLPGRRAEGREFPIRLSTILSGRRIGELDGMTVHRGGQPICDDENRAATARDKVLELDRSTKFRESTPCGRSPNKLQTRTAGVKTSPVHQGALAGGEDSVEHADQGRADIKGGWLLTPGRRQKRERKTPAFLASLSRTNALYLASISLPGRPAGATVPMMFPACGFRGWNWPRLRQFDGWRWRWGRRRKKVFDHFRN